jgi:hypothetical protein
LERLLYLYKNDWSDGVLECWGDGVLEQWSGGVMEYCKGKKIARIEIPNYKTQISNKLPLLRFQVSGVRCQVSGFREDKDWSGKSPSESGDCR